VSGASTSEASRSGAGQRCDEPSPTEHIAANGRAQEKKYRPVLALATPALEIAPNAIT
jgi:hypothetical protein